MRRFSDIKGIIRIFLCIARRRKSEFTSCDRSRRDMNQNLILPIFQFREINFIGKIHIIHMFYILSVYINICNGIDSFKFYIFRSVCVFEVKLRIIPDMSVFEILHCKCIQAKERISNDICLIKVKLKITRYAGRDFRKLFLLQ